MRTLCLLILFLSPLSVPQAAEPSAEATPVALSSDRSAGALSVPARAERAWRSERYDEALSLYEAALEESADAPGALLYNMGNCAYRSGRHAAALLFYRRAELRMPRDGRIRFNRILAEEQLGLEKPSIASFADSVEKLLDSFTPGEFLATTALLQAIGLVGFVLLRRRRGLRGAMVLLVLLSLAGGARLVRHQWFPGPPEAIVLDDRIAVRPEPHAALVVSFELGAGETVRVAERGVRWARIEHDQGEGWTETPGLGLVE